jgi:hypothetical protein
MSHFQQQPFQPQPEPQPKKKHTGRIVLTVIAAGLAVVIAGGIAAGLAEPKASQTTLPNVVTTTDKPTVTRSTAPTTAPVATPKPTPAPTKITPTPKPTPVVYKKLTKREWAKIAKSPDSHVGETITVYGVVTQFDAATGQDGFRADVDSMRHADSFEYPTNTVFQQQAAGGLLDDLVQGDFFTAKVRVVGSYSYDTQIGGNTTVPSLEVVSIKVTK